MAVIKMTPETVEQAMRDTDWARLDAQTDENAAGDPDAAPLLNEVETALAMPGQSAGSDGVRLSGRLWQTIWSRHV